MKIEQLHIDGFGHFSGTSIGPLDGNIVVFHGANEAGKSTLHNFLQTVLFGFSRAGTPLAPVPALAGGRHGGRVVVTGTDGGRYTIERHAGAHRGKVTLTMPDGSTGGQAELDDLFNIPSEVYCNVFSFDLQQLFDEKSLERDEIKTNLYGAGMGVENLQGALNNLENRMDTIYLASGRQRSRKVTDLVNRIAEIDRQLVVARHESETWYQHQERLNEIGSEIQHLHTTRDQAIAERRKQQAVLDAIDDWEALQAALARLELLPEIVTFPEDGPARLQALETALSGARQEEQRVQRQLAEVLLVLEQPVVDAALAGQREDIELLREELGGFADRVEREAALGQEISTIDQQIAAGLNDIGAGWTVEQTIALDTSVAERDEIAGHRQTLATAAGTLQQARHQLESAVSEEERAAASLAAAEGQLTIQQAVATSTPALNALQEQVRQARAAQQELKDARAQYDQHRQMLAATGEANPLASTASTTLIAGAGLMLFGILATVAGLLSDSSTALVIGLLLGLVAIAAGVAILLSGQRSSARDRTGSGVGSQSRQIAANLEAAQARANETFSRLDLVDPARPESSLDALQDRIASAANLLQQAGSARADVQHRQESLDRARLRAGQEQERLDQAVAGWQAWLVARGLRENISPEMAEAILDRAGRIRSEHQRREQMQRERAELSARTGAFVERYRRVVAAIGEPGTATMSDTAPAVRMLVERFDAAREALGQRARQAEQLAALQRDHRQRRDDLAAVEQDLAELLALGGANDPEEFRTRARQAAERREADHNRAGIEHRLKRQVPAGQDWPQFSAMLEQSDASTVDQSISELVAAIEQVEQRVAGLQDERGSVRQKMSSLENDQSAGVLRAERAQLEDQLAEDAREWSSYALAQAILTRARARYEAERQPEVLQTAERVFRQLTGGRYTGVMSPVGSNEIEVVRADEQRLKRHELSRGTRDQLFLALRFGLVASFGQTTAHLPVIVDDVLVNFDPRRARAAAGAFAELSSTNQVLIFTCHETTVDHVLDAMPDAQIVPLEVPKG